MTDQPSDSPGHSRAMNAIRAGGEFHDIVSQRVFRSGGHLGHPILGLQGSGDVPDWIGSFIINEEDAQGSLPSFISDSDRIRLGRGRGFVKKVQS